MNPESALDWKAKIKVCQIQDYMHILLAWKTKLYIKKLRKIRDCSARTLNYNAVHSKYIYSFFLWPHFLITSYLRTQRQWRCKVQIFGNELHKGISTPKWGTTINKIIFKVFASFTGKSVTFNAWFARNHSINIHVVLLSQISEQFSQYPTSRHT